MIAVAALAALLALTPAARGEDALNAVLERVGLDRLDALTGEAGLPNAREIAARALSGGLTRRDDLPGRALRALARRVREGLLQALGLLIAPVSVSLALRMALGRRDGPLSLLCRLACAAGLMERCAAALIEVRGAVAAAAEMARTVSPVLATALTLTGSTSAAATLTPMTALCASAIESALLGAGIPMCALAAAVAAAGGLSERFRLDRLFELLRRATGALVGLTVAGFAALLSAQGRLAAAQDVGATRAAGQALLNLIPVVGGALSNSADALFDAAVAVRGAVGVTGGILALSACAGPALTLTALTLSVRLAAAVIEPVADPCVAWIVARFGDVLGMLLAVCAGSYALAALLAGACLGGGAAL